ncbi:MAG: ATP-binding cassette domain-containing protein [Actinomycetota bacterium]|nr:ATP-binding cassette domain-containing protein [Actinomycetota bacterium]
MTVPTSLDLHRVVVRHRGRPLVDVADLRLEPGRPVTIVGESGSGKSVLAHAVMGTLDPELEVVGAMSVGSRRLDLADRGNRRFRWGRDLALLPQEPALALDPTMRVRGQVAEGVPGFRRHDRRAAEVADAALGRLGLSDAGAAYPHTLSGGMAQRVAYAAATVGGARVLIVDEPSKGLDPASLDRLADLLAEHTAGGGILLTITHDLRLARRIGGRVLVMREASVVEEGAAEQVLDAPAHDYTRRLLAAEPSRWRHRWAPVLPPADPPPDLITATAVTKSYGAASLFEDLSLRIGAGERWAVSGPSGVGKTTLGNVLLRLTSVDRGAVEHAPAAEGGRLQKLYQDPTLSFPARVRLGLAMTDVVKRHDVAAGRLQELMTAVGLPHDLLDRRPAQVSGGELQRLAIVRAMMTRPVLVFADEATSRLDLVTQEVTVDCLMTELSESGCALLLVTHDRELATAVADHHLVLGAPGRSRASVTGILPV